MLYATEHPSFPLSNESKKKISNMRQRREALAARGPKTIIKPSKTSIIHHRV